MNLLVIHEVNYLTKIIYEFQILPEILSMLGHNVTVIDYDDTWPASGGGSIRLRTTVHENVHRAYPEASVTVRRPGMIRAPMLSRISGAVASGLEVVNTMRRSKFDAVLLYGLPTVGVQALCAARAFGIPIMFRSIDILHRLAPNRLLIPPTRFLEWLVYRRVDAISCVTPHLKAYVESYGVPPSRVDVLPSGVDVGLFHPGPRNEALLAKWGIGRADRVVLFMGTIYSFSGLDRVIRDFHKILRGHPDARLLVVGVGEDRSRLESLAASAGIQDRVIFAGLQPYALLPDLIRSSDVCINPFELNTITRDILPTKLFQYLACGRPVLMTELPGTLPFLSGPADGVVYTSLNDFADRLTELLDSRTCLEELGVKAALVARRDYDWRSIAAKLVGWIEQRAS